MSLILIDTAQTIVELQRWLMEFKDNGTTCTRKESDQMMLEILRLRKELIKNSRGVLKELRTHLTQSEWDDLLIEVKNEENG